MLSIHNTYTGKTSIKENSMRFLVVFKLLVIIPAVLQVIKIKQRKGPFFVRWITASERKSSLKKNYHCHVHLQLSQVQRNIHTQTHTHTCWEPEIFRSTAVQRKKWSSTQKHVFHSIFCLLAASIGQAHSRSSIRCICRVFHIKGQSITTKQEITKNNGLLSL